jgi:hypothetical protein
VRAEVRAEIPDRGAPLRGGARRLAAFHSGVPGSPQVLREMPGFRLVDACGEANHAVDFVQFVVEGTGDRTEIRHPPLNSSMAS